jgi:hypothetical protein
MNLLPIVLEEGFRATISVGDKISEGQIIAKREGKKEKIISLKDHFNLPLKNLSKTLKKNPGDSVKEGETLAEHKKVLGLGSKKVLSTVSGTLIRFDEEKGELLIRALKGEGEEEDLISPVDGVVDSLQDYKIVIRTERNILPLKNAIGTSVKGPTFFPKDTNDSSIDLEVSGKILVGENFDHLSLFKALGLGAKGVVGKFFEDDFDILKSKILDGAVCLVDGETFSKMLQYKNQEIYLDPIKRIILL